VAGVNKWWNNMEWALEHPNRKEYLVGFGVSLNVKTDTVNNVYGQSDFGFC
jgi:hypothetical protein